MPDTNRQPYNSTTAYILGDIAPDDDIQIRDAAYYLHRRKCDATRQIFTNCIDCESPVKLVPYGPGSDSDSVIQYFRAEILTKTSDDLMFIYVHADSRGNGNECRC
jgi:hypothetical protein